MKTAEQVWKEAYAKGRNDGLEAAAKVSDEWVKSKSCDHHDSNPCCHVRLAVTISEKIRALKAGKP